MSQDRTNRYNTNKINFILIPWEWLQVLAEIFTFGAKKYAPNNWKLSVNTEDHDSLRNDRMDSALRHIVSYMRHEKIDPESNQPHLGHAAWNLLCVLWYDMNDTRGSK